MTKHYSSSPSFRSTSEKATNRLAESFEANNAKAMSNPSGQNPTLHPTLYKVETGVARITLNMADRKNSLSKELLTSLGQDLTAAYEDPGVRIVVLSNNGNTFCAGADLSAADPGVAKPDDSKNQGTFVSVLKLILDGTKPVLGRIDGHATGGGVGLAAACDISVMRDDAKLGFTEVRLGVAPAVISVVCLPKMNASDGMELFLSGEQFSPQRAVDVGLISRCAPPTEIDSTIDSFIDMICRGGPKAIAATKGIVRRVPTMDRQSAFELMSVESQTLFRSEEAAAGIAAFRNREPAPWVQ